MPPSAKTAPPSRPARLPLNSHFVAFSTCGSHCFRAANRQHNDTATAATAVADGSHAVQGRRTAVVHAHDSAVACGGVVGELNVVQVSHGTALAEVATHTTTPQG